MNAIFTIVQNDTTFTKRWVDYHSDFFDAVFILDHDSVGDATEMLEHIKQQASVVQVHYPYSYDAAWMARTVRHFHAFLLQSFDTVCFTAVDEFLVPRGGGSLGDWLKSFRASAEGAARADGYEVVHYKGQEPPLDWDASLLLPQRRMWYSCRMYSKPVAGKQPIFWMPGFSDATNVPAAIDVGLLLIHLHRIDYDECLRKHREVRAREWLPAAKIRGPFRQNRVEEPDALSRWMLCNADDSGNYATLEEIPERFKVI